MIAFLGMYDPPPLQAANDRFWQAIRARLGRGPEALTRGGDPWAIWRSPDLLFGQTCGYPYRAALHEEVTLVGTPDYGLGGCPPGHYQSLLVVRKDDPRQTEDAFAGACFAYNDPLSQSGWAAPMVHLRARALLPGAYVRTGAHAASAHAVANGHAEIAGIDALSWRLMQAHDPVAQNLRVMAGTEPTPGLPYITARGQDADEIAAAVVDAIDDLDPSERAALHLEGLVRLPPEAYLAVPTPPAPDA